MIYYPPHEIFRYQKFPHAFQTLRKIVRSNTSLLQVYKTKLLKLYWSHLFDMPIVRQFLVNQRRWRCIAHNALEYTVLPRSEKSKNSETFFKILNPWGRIHNSSWSIFSKDFVHISYSDGLFLILENFYMHLIYFLIKFAFWFAKCLFWFYGDTLS